MAQLSSIPAIAEFPIGKWRLQWLGRINRNDNVQTEPTIEVILHPIGNEKQKPIAPLIGVGQLPLLTIGSIWENKHKIAETSGEIISIPSININQHTTHIIDAWERFPNDQDKYIIPPYEWSTKSPTHCLAIHYNNDPYGIIIPCAELARFYYCRSTDLSLAAFNGIYNSELHKIINPQETDLTVNPPSIHLRKWFSNKDAWVIGRILLSHEAKQGVNLIYKSIQAYAANKGMPAPFKCDLPFVGNTTLKARVHKIQLPNGGVRYLVLELIECGGVFPYSDLEVGRDNPGLGDKSVDDLEPESDGTTRPHWLRQGKPKAHNIPLQSQQETNKSICSVNIPIEDLKPFTFLLNKTLKIKDQNITPSTHKTKNVNQHPNLTRCQR